MDPIELKICNVASAFVKDCYRALEMYCKFHRRPHGCEINRFIELVKDAGIVSSELQFIDYFYRTKNCFDLQLVDDDGEGCVIVRSIHPERFSFDEEYMQKVVNATDGFHWDSSKKEER